MKSKIIRGLLFGGLFVVATLAVIHDLATAKENAPAAVDKNGSVDEGEEFCATEHDRRRIEANEKVFAKQRKALPLNSQGGGAITVHFHIIHDGRDGIVSDETINEQMRILGSAYRRYGFSFDLGSVERVYQPQWFNACQAYQVEFEMKSALRVGSADDLNIYTCWPAGGVAGWGTFPMWYSANPLFDGIVLHYGYLPGGYKTQSTPYNTGEVSIHEAGHWLGLYHTFQGGCDGDGDFVDDTPYEAAPAPFCPISCPIEHAG